MPYRRKKQEEDTRDIFEKALDDPRTGFFGGAALGALGARSKVGRRFVEKTVASGLGGIGGALGGVVLQSGARAALDRGPYKKAKDRRK